MQNVYFNSLGATSELKYREAYSLAIAEWNKLLKFSNNKGRNIFVARIRGRELHTPTVANYGGAKALRANSPTKGLDRFETSS